MIFAYHIALAFPALLKSLLTFNAIIIFIAQRIFNFLSFNRILIIFVSKVKVAKCY